MNNENNYIQGLFGGLKSLCTGLKTTMREFSPPKSPSNILKTAEN